MWIEMIMNMSGTRANGERYPPSFTPLDVEDWEGEHLIRGGMARECSAPEAKDPQPAPPPVPVPGQDLSAQVPPAPQPAVQPVVPSAGPPPAPADPKQAWVDYAVTQGMNAEDASKMTKIDLQSRFGGRL